MPCNPDDKLTFDTLFDAIMDFEEVITDMANAMDIVNDAEHGASFDILDDDAMVKVVALMDPRLRARIPTLTKNGMLGLRKVVLAHARYVAKMIA